MKPDLVFGRIQECLGLYGSKFPVRSVTVSPKKKHLFPALVTLALIGRIHFPRVFFGMLSCYLMVLGLLVSVIGAG